MAERHLVADKSTVTVVKPLGVDGRLAEVGERFSSAQIGDTVDSLVAAGFLAYKMVKAPTGGAPKTKKATG